MLSLSRFPTKKRKKKKSSSLPSSLLPNSDVAELCSIASEKLDDEGHYDDKSSQSSIQKNLQVHQKTDIESLKENQEQQVQLLKRQRERKKRRKMRMESAFESILKPSNQHSDSSELKRMERLFWDDDDHVGNHDAPKQNSEASSSEISTKNPSHSDKFISGAKSTSTRDRDVVKRSRPSIPNLSLEIPIGSAPLFGEPPIQSSSGRKGAKPKRATETRPPIPSGPTTSTIERIGKKSVAEGDRANSSPTTTRHNNGIGKGKTNREQTTGTNLDSSMFTSQEIADHRQKDPGFSEAKKTVSMTPRNIGDGISFQRTCQYVSAGEKSPGVELDCAVSQPKKTIGSGQPSSVPSGADVLHLSLDRAPEFRDMEFRAEKASLPSCGSRERPTGFQFGHNGAVEENDKDNSGLPTANDYSLRPVRNEDVNGKVVSSKQSSRKAKKDYKLTGLVSVKTAVSGADEADEKRAEILLSARPTLVEVLPPSFCGNTEKESAPTLERRRELSALQIASTRSFQPHNITKMTPTSIPTSMDKLDALRDEPEETSWVQAEATGNVSGTVELNSSTLVSESEASKLQSSSKGTMDVKTDTKEENVASGDKGVRCKKKPSKGLSKKKTQVPVTECIDRDCDNGEKRTSKKAKRGKKRGRGLCALCATCACRKLGGDDTIVTLGVQSFARSDCAMEKALIRRLKKIEKSSESLQEQQEVIKRKLKKHRRDMLRRKTKVSPEEKDASYFLPDVEELESSECKPFKLAGDWVAFAQNKMFPSALVCNQQSLTQLGFLSSKSSKPANKVVKTPDATVNTPHEEASESGMDDSGMASSRCHLRDDEIESDEQPEASHQELATEEDSEDKDPGYGYVEPHRISWRSGSKLSSTNSNNIVATSALEGLIVHPEEVEDVDDANSVLSPTNEESPMGRAEPCPWDIIFADCAMGDEICDIDQLLKLIDSDKSYLHSTKESSTYSVSVVGDSVGRHLELKPGEKEAANGLINKISSDGGKVKALNQVCPNWKENVSFAFSRSKEEIQDALQNLQESQRRLDQTKQMIVDAWHRNRMTMDVFKEALEKSLDQHEPNRFKQNT